MEIQKLFCRNLPVASVLSIRNHVSKTRDYKVQALATKLGWSDIVAMTFTLGGDRVKAAA